MYGEPHGGHFYAPDGLAGEVLDELIERAYAEVADAPGPTSALLNGSAAEQRRRRMERRALAALTHALPMHGSALHARWAVGRVIHDVPASRSPLAGGDDENPTKVHNTRPGGPNRQERAHRVGAPESPAEAIEESGMVQVQTCVSVHCDQCGDAVGSPWHEAHYPTEDAALDAAAAEGWLVGPGGLLWCSACGPVLMCEAEGHEFSEWRHPVTANGQPARSAYRHCRRCCLDEFREAQQLIDSHPERDTVTALALGAGIEGTGEVA